MRKRGVEELWGALPSEWGTGNTEKEQSGGENPIIM